ncbi:MAG: hypothetical protein Q9187_003950 [Circinaria calcarea]
MADPFAPQTYPTTGAGMIRLGDFCRNFFSNNIRDTSRHTEPTTVDRFVSLIMHNDSFFGVAKSEIGELRRPQDCPPDANPRIQRVLVGTREKRLMAVRMGTQPSPEERAIHQILVARVQGQIALNRDNPTNLEARAMPRIVEAWREVIGLSPSYQQQQPEQQWQQLEQPRQHSTHPPLPYRQAQEQQDLQEGGPKQQIQQRRTHHDADTKAKREVAGRQSLEQERSIPDGLAPQPGGSFHNENDSLGNSPALVTQGIRDSLSPTPSTSSTMSRLASSPIIRASSRLDASPGAQRPQRESSDYSANQQMQRGSSQLASGGRLLPRGSEEGRVSGAEGRIAFGALPRLKPNPPHPDERMTQAELDRSTIRVSSRRPAEPIGQSTAMERTPSWAEQAALFPTVVPDRENKNTTDRFNQLQTELNRVREAQAKQRREGVEDALLHGEQYKALLKTEMLEVAKEWLPTRIGTLDEWDHDVQARLDYLSAAPTLYLSANAVERRLVEKVAAQDLKAWLVKELKKEKERARRGLSLR